jgi:enterochelin esterase-like enzyme
MLDQITPWVTQGGAVALLLAAMWLVLTGRIVARSVLDQQRLDLLAWKDAAEKANTTNAEMSGHMGQLVVTVDKAVDSMRETQQLIREVLAARKDPV